MLAQRLAGMAVAGLFTAGCASSAAPVLPAQGPGQYTYPYPDPVHYRDPGAPQPAPQPATPQTIVTPVFWVPSDVYLDQKTELYMTSLIGSHLALAQSRYQKLLVTDTFHFNVEQPITYRSRLTMDQLEASPPDTAHTMTRELLAWRGDDRVNSHRIYVTLIVRPPERPCGKARGLRCMGGARPFNATGWGGGFVQLEAANLLDGKHFQSTLQHELGHAFGLSHADCHGQSMSEGTSIMSYNKAHWSTGLQEAPDPGNFTAEDLVTLARNRGVFPRLADSPQIADLARRPLVGVSGECDMRPMDASIGPVPPPTGQPGQTGQYNPGQWQPQQPGYGQAPQGYGQQPYPQAAPPPAAAPPGRGYELFYDGRRVSGPDAQFYTRDRAQRHCASIIQLHRDVRVDCSFDGVRFNGSR